MIFCKDFKTGTLTPVYGYGSSLHAAEWNAEPGRKTKTRLKEPPLLRLLLRASSSSLCSYALIEDVEGGEEDFSDFDFDDFDDDSDGGTGGGGRVKVMMSKPIPKEKKKGKKVPMTGSQRELARRARETAREKRTKKRIRERNAENQREKREKDPKKAAAADEGRSRKAAWKSGWRTPEQLEREKQKEEPKKRKRGMEDQDQKKTKKPRGA